MGQSLRKWPHGYLMGYAGMAGQGLSPSPLPRGVPAPQDHQQATKPSSPSSEPATDQQEIIQTMKTNAEDHMIPRKPLHGIHHAEDHDTTQPTPRHPPRRRPRYHATHSTASTTAMTNPGADIKPNGRTVSSNSHPPHCAPNSHPSLGRTGTVPQVLWISTLDSIITPA